MVDFVCQKYLNSADPDQTEAIWSGSTLFAILTHNLWIPALTINILFQNRKKVFEILLYLGFIELKPEINIFGWGRGARVGVGCK